MSDEFEELSMDLDDDDFGLEEEDYVEEPPREVKSKKPSSTKSSGKITVYFQSTIGPTQKQEKLLVATEAPVGDVKYTVGQIFSLGQDDFHLSYLGRTLDPNDVIANYEIEDGDTILLIPVSTAGN